MKVLAANIGNARAFFVGLDLRPSYDQLVSRQGQTIIDLAGSHLPTGSASWLHGRGPRLLGLPTCDRKCAYGRQQAGSNDVPAHEPGLATRHPNEIGRYQRRHASDGTSHLVNEGDAGIAHLRIEQIA